MRYEYDEEIFSLDSEVHKLREDLRHIDSYLERSKNSHLYESWVRTRQRTEALLISKERRLIICLKSKIMRLKKQKSS